MHGPIEDEVLVEEVEDEVGGEVVSELRRCSVTVEKTTVKRRKRNRWNACGISKMQVVYVFVKQRSTTRHLDPFEPVGIEPGSNTSQVST